MKHRILSNKIARLIHEKPYVHWVKAFGFSPCLSVDSPFTSLIYWRTLRTKECILSIFPSFFYRRHFLSYFLVYDHSSIQFSHYTCTHFLDFLFINCTTFWHKSYLVIEPSYRISPLTSWVFHGCPSSSMFSES